MRELLITSESFTVNLLNSKTECAATAITEALVDIDCFEKKTSSHNAIDAGSLHRVSTVSLQCLSVVPLLSISTISLRCLIISLVEILHRISIVSVVSPLVSLKDFRIPKFDSELQIPEGPLKCKMWSQISGETRFCSHLVNSFRTPSNIFYHKPQISANHEL